MPFGHVNKMKSFNCLFSPDCLNMDSLQIYLFIVYLVHAYQLQKDKKSCSNGVILDSSQEILFCKHYLYIILFIDLWSPKWWENLIRIQFFWCRAVLIKQLLKNVCEFFHNKIFNMNVTSLCRLYHFNSAISYAIKEAGSSTN